jgi:hypothetical protein
MTQARDGLRERVRHEFENECGKVQP